MSHPFTDLGIPADLAKGLEELGIMQPTAIQRQAIPYLLKRGFDLVGQAQTGTGKTAAFGLPLLIKVDPKETAVQGLIICPTRELAKQVGKQLFRFTKYAQHKTFIEVCCGGDKIQVQAQRLQRPTHIVVGTPGRLIELLEKKHLSLQDVKYLVLDEADEMLSMGFKEQLRELLNQTPQKKATWLFSATFPQAIEELISTCMQPDPKLIQVSAKNVVNRQISHRYILCEKEEKDDRIAEFLESKKEERGLLFCRTKAGANMLGKVLTSAGFNVAVLQGDLTQGERDKIMRAFKKERTQFLIATDVAARGIDIDGLRFVLHHQLPDQLDYYTHRAGRTGRAGNTGHSVVLLEPHEKERLERLEEILQIHFRAY